MPKLLRRIGEVEYYDPVRDSLSVRFSGFSDRGGEFWVSEPRAPAGRQRRLQRERVAVAIQQAIEAGHEPGEVLIEVEEDPYA